VIGRYILSDVRSLPDEMAWSYLDYLARPWTWERQGSGRAWFHFRELQRGGNKWKRVVKLFNTYLDGKKFKVETITAIYNPNLITAFLGTWNTRDCDSRRHQKYEQGQGVSIPEVLDDPHVDERKFVSKCFRQRVKKMKWNEENYGNWIVPVAHGTSVPNAMSICQRGFAALGRTDGGWFGKGKHNPHSPHPSSRAFFFLLTQPTFLLAFFCFVPLAFMSSPLSSCFILLWPHESLNLSPLLSMIDFVTFLILALASTTVYPSQFSYLHDASPASHIPQPPLFVIPRTTLKKILGIYFTTYALYTLPYMKPQKEPAIIISWVLPGTTTLLNPPSQPGYHLFFQGRRVSSWLLRLPSSSRNRIVLLLLFLSLWPISTLPTCSWDLLLVLDFASIAPRRVLIFLCFRKFLSCSKSRNRFIIRCSNQRRIKSLRRNRLRWKTIHFTCF
jgi:hypothetical protein